MDRDLKMILGATAIFALIIFLVILNPISIISAGSRGVVLKFGNIDRVLTEGIHFRIPFVESIKVLDVTTKKEEVSSTAASKDLQSVSAKVAVNYNLAPDKVGEIYRSYQYTFDSVLIAPAIQESIKAATAKYTAEELITKREFVRGDILTNLNERLSINNIIVTAVSITDFDFSPEFNKSIESKVKAEQDALTAKNKLEQVKYEAEQSIARAQAEAQSIRLQSEAANNEKYVHLKEIEVRLEMSKRWDGKLPVNMYANVPLPLLDITK